MWTSFSRVNTHLDTRICCQVSQKEDGRERKLILITFIQSSCLIVHLYTHAEQVYYVDPQRYYYVPSTTKLITNTEHCTCRYFFMIDRALAG